MINSSTWIVSLTNLDQKKNSSIADLHRTLSDFQNLTIISLTAQS